MAQAVLRQNIVVKGIVKAVVAVGAQRFGIQHFGVGSQPAAVAIFGDMQVLLRLLQSRFGYGDAFLCFLTVKPGFSNSQGNPGRQLIAQPQPGLGQLQQTVGMVATDPFVEDIPSEI